MTSLGPAHRVRAWSLYPVWRGVHASCLHGGRHLPATPCYYNEIDPYAAQWLRNLIADGLLPYGDVDERSIADVQPSDLGGYVQCHFFAGIGGWPYAARLAGWPEDRPLWTGSCPCQPFAVGGQRRGFADDRHLWPQFRRLIAKQQPPVVFGEQVASASAWLRLVRGDLEVLGYAVGAFPIEAACAAAEHFRDRYWFVGDLEGERWRERGPEPEVRGWRTAAASAGGPDRSSLVQCHDGIWRRKPPSGVRMLGTGVPARIPKLRAFGNAIDPRPAAAFIKAYVEAEASASWRSMAAVSYT